MSFVRLFAAAAWLLVSTGCGSASMFMLFASTPDFTLEAEEADDGSVLLEISDVDPISIEDDLCESDDSEDCKDDIFMGFALYRSDEGEYGTYEQVAQSMEREFVDYEPTETTAWRAAILFQEEEDELRITEVSTAAVLPLDEEE